ncbi:MAG: hypothetical protein ACREE0_16330 [Phenylobacterium sp.]
MLWKTAALIVAAILLTGAAPAPKAAAPKPAAAKPAPKADTPAAKPAPAGFVDARDPASMVALLATAGAKGEIAHREADSVFLAVSSASVSFTAQFAGCDAQGRKCTVVLFDNQNAGPSPTLGQINSFNQTSATCRGYQDKGGKAHILYSTLLFANDSSERITQHLAAWRGCLADFGTFVKDPTAYLAEAP